MIILLTIFQYFIQSVLDVSDKFLITARKIEPISYTFFTVAMGALLAVAWPFAYYALPVKFVFLNLFSGAFFSLAMFVFYKALSQGEVSRVIPFVFGLVPVFDVVIGTITGQNILSVREVSAICMLIPGALLISYKPRSFSTRHIVLKVLSAFLFSAYYALWQYGAQEGPTLNNLIWNRLGAAAVLVIPLCFASYRKKVFAYQDIKNKKQTSVLFLIKQVLGGANFIFLSELLVVGKIAIINALQGFRYLFLFCFAFFWGKKYGQTFNEVADPKLFKIKFFASTLIFFGTIILFWK